MNVRTLSGKPFVTPEPSVTHSHGPNPTALAHLLPLHRAVALAAVENRLQETIGRLNRETWGTTEYYEAETAFEQVYATRLELNAEMAKNAAGKPDDEALVALDASRLRNARVYRLPPAAHVGELW